MKIVQVNAVYGYGSTGLIVQDLEQAILNVNDEAIIVYQDANDMVQKGIRVGNKLDWKIHALLTRICGKQGYFSYRATKRLIKELISVNPDIVHLHNLHSNYIHLPMLLRYLAKENIATVLTLHDCWFFTGKCFHFMACQCDKWKIKCENCPQNKMDVKSWFVDATAQVFRDKKELMQNIPNLTIVGCSNWILNLAKQSPIFQGKRFSRIYNGVDTSIFTMKDRFSLRKELCVSDKFVILGMANKWLLDSNRLMLLKVIKGLKSDEALILVGCTDEQKKILPNSNQVITFGFVNGRSQMADIYNIADVFVNLTFEDTLPTVNMESICCGTPVVTYDSCGSPELVLSSKTGYVIPQLDYAALREAISWIREGKIDRESCSNLGKEMFEKSKQYQRYLTLYKNILNQQ